MCRPFHPQTLEALEGISQHFIQQTLRDEWSVVNIQEEIVFAFSVNM